MMNKNGSIQINQLQHTGVPVTNIRVSETFYAGLGFNNVMEATFTQGTETGTCIMMKNGTIIIELYQLPPQQLQEIKTRKDGHIDHIAFDVDDIELAFSQAKATGYHILEEAPVFLSFWTNGCRYFNITGPDGERLEFNQIIK